MKIGKISRDILEEQSIWNPELNIRILGLALMITIVEILACFDGYYLVNQVYLIYKNRHS